MSQWEEVEVVHNAGRGQAEGISSSSLATVGISFVLIVVPYFSGDSLRCIETLKMNPLFLSGHKLHQSGKP